MADPSEMLIHSNQSFPEDSFCCNPSLLFSQPAKTPSFLESPFPFPGDLSGFQLLNLFIALELAPCWRECCHWVPIQTVLSSGAGRFR